MRKKTKITLLVVAAVLLVLIVGIAIYLGIYYRADDTALAALASDDVVRVNQKEQYVSFEPEEPEVGLIFYPGGKVEHTAYAPLMRALAERGVLCVVVEMPFRLAVFDVNKADCVRGDFPQIRCWYMAGHSLGGSMAANYVANHSDSFQGLILLAAYSTTDLSGSGLDVLSVFGDQDEVMNRKKYEKYRGNLPADMDERIISGGNHAQFGSYGPQSGDGEARITAQEQVQITADLIVEFMNIKARTVWSGLCAFRGIRYAFFFRTTKATATASTATTAIAIIQIKELLLSSQSSQGSEG